MEEFTRESKGGQTHMENKVGNAVGKCSKYMSRKLVAFIINDLILTGFMVMALLIEASILTSAVLISFMALIVLNGVTYIGGKALEVWAKSKYFRSELFNK
jgi:hypothetical protein